MNVDIITILPEMFAGPMSASIVGRARERSLLGLSVHDLREYTDDRHRTTDDYPYGGGPGMVMKPEPLFRAVRKIQESRPERPHTVFLTPSGEPFTQSLAQEFSTLPGLLLVCGRYEGFDERTLSLADRQVSIGDYVLTGGELAAMVVVDALTRLIPGVLGHDESAAEESFSESLLEYPHYTRPVEFEGMRVPDVLLSGDHARIAAYRRVQSVLRTVSVRPDMIEEAELTEEERAIVRRALEGSNEGD